MLGIDYGYLIILKLKRKCFNSPVYYKLYINCDGFAVNGQKGSLIQFFTLLDAIL